MVPCHALLSARSTLKFGNDATARGNVPFSRLELISSCSRAVMFPISGGNGPSNWQLRAVSDVNVVINANSLGRRRRLVFPMIVSHVSDVEWPNSVGRTVIWLVSRDK
jgi:hypothetical protein